MERGQTMVRAPWGSDRIIDSLILAERFWGTNNEFNYSDPAVRNVKVWKVPVDRMTGKVFGLRADEKP